MQIIGIAGPSGAGKSLFTENLIRQIRDKHPHDGVQSVGEDCYYVCQTHMSFPEREQVNYDHPSAFEHELLIDHIHQLRQGQSIERPTYDYETHDRKPERTIILPSKVLIVEGIMLFHNPSLRQQFDLKLFVDAPLDVCLVRRLRRDVEKRGRDMESILRQYEASVRPMYYEFVQPTMQFADVIIPRGGDNPKALGMINYYLEQFV